MIYRFGFQIDLFLDQLRASRKAQTTIDAYRRHLRYFKTWVKCKDDVRIVDERIVTNYREHIASKEKYSPDWRLRSLSSLKRFYAWLSLQDVLLADPTAKLILPRGRSRRLPPYLSQSDVGALLQAADPQTPAGLRDRAILESLYSTGMRASECYRLQIADINFADGLIRINSGKGKKDRVVPIGETALRFIERYIADTRGSRLSGPLFRKKISSRPIDSYDLGKILKRCGEKAGITIHLYPHLLRHSFAVHLLENGAGIRHIQEMLGHENLVATQIYTRVVPVQLKRVHDAAHPAARHTEKLPADLSPQGYYKNRTVRRDKGTRRVSSFSR
jgi:integrase/recombinase XerD